MTRMTPARRRTAALLALPAAGLLLAGCSLRAPNTAVQPYAPADGLQAELGDVLVRNMLVVSEGDGAPGVLVGALVNRGEEDTTVQLEVSGTTAELDVPAGASVALGSGEDRPDGELSTVLSETVEVDQVEAAAGGAVDLVVTAPASGSTELRVPVVLPTGPYAGLVEGGSGGASAEPSDEPSEEPSEVPTEEASAGPGSEPTSEATSEPSGPVEVSGAPSAQPSSQG